MAEETFEQTFAVPAPARLALSNIRGSVRIERSDEGVIAVRAIKHTDTGDDQGTEVIMEQAGDGSVRVETRYQDFRNWFLARKPCKVDYHVSVPQQCSMSVSGVSNSAEIRGVEGEQKLSTVSGQVHLIDVHGQLKVNTVSGGFTGERLSGTLTFDTVSGNVSLTECSFASVNGSTVSGGVKVETLLAEGPYHFNSVSGGVLLRLPAVTACTIETDSLSGRLSSSLPVTEERSTRWHGPGGREVVDLNGGGIRIKHHSVSGGLRLEPLGGDGSEAGLTGEQAAPGEKAERQDQPRLSKMEILERIERGEITPEQAVELMK